MTWQTGTVSGITSITSQLYWVAQEKSIITITWGSKAITGMPLGVSGPGSNRDSGRPMGATEMPSWAAEIESGTGSWPPPGGLQNCPAGCRNRLWTDSWMTGTDSWMPSGLLNCPPGAAGTDSRNDSWMTGTGSWLILEKPQRIGNLRNDLNRFAWGKDGCRDLNWPRSVWIWFVGLRYDPSSLSRLGHNWNRLDLARIASAVSVNLGVSGTGMTAPGMAAAVSVNLGCLELVWLLQRWPQQSQST